MPIIKGFIQDLGIIGEYFQNFFQNFFNNQYYFSSFKFVYIIFLATINLFAVLGPNGELKWSI